MKKPHKQPMSEGKKITYFLVGLFAVIMIIGGTMFYVLSSGSDSSGSANGARTAEVQEVRMQVNGYTYEPAVLTVESGKTVRWEIDSSKAAGCARSIVMPSMGVRQSLNGGQQVIEFTPTQKGTLQFSCSMGMVRGEFRVV